MAEEPTKRYWDSSVFLAWIKGEPGRADTVDKIIADAQAGRCVIYASMITLAEVTKPARGPIQVGKAVEDKIAAFFKNDYIKLVPVDYVIGTKARQLIWDFPFLGPRDSIHIATAIHVGVEAIEHYDGDFEKVRLRASAQKVTGLPLIREPEWKGQETLVFPDPAEESEPADALPAASPEPEQDDPIDARLRNIEPA